MTPETPTLGEIYWRAAMTDPDDAGAFPALAPNHHADVERGAHAVASAAIQRRIDSLGPAAFPESHPADRDEPKAAKVIVVAEGAVPGCMPVERRYNANQAEITEDLALRLTRKGHEVGGYQPNGWLSWREDGATTTDATAWDMVETLQCQVNDLHDLVRDILQSLPDTADEYDWRDRAGALSVHDLDGQPYAAPDNESARELAAEGNATAMSDAERDEYDRDGEAWLDAQDEAAEMASVHLDYADKDDE